MILAVTTHVKQNNNITFTDDNGLVPLFERWSYEGLRKGKFNSVFNYTNWAVWGVKKNQRGGVERLIRELKAVAGNGVEAIGCTPADSSSGRSPTSAVLAVV